MRAFAIVGAILLASCVGPRVPVTNVDDAMAAQLNTSVKVVDGAALPANARLLGPVQATSCKNKAWQPAPTNENAITQMKLLAQQMGGNAIGSVYCEPPLGTDLKTNCWSSIRCTGTALSVAG